MTTEPHEHSNTELAKNPTAFLTRRRLIVWSVALLALWLFLGWVPYFMTKNNGDPQARAGEYGDMFGMASSFFGAVGLLAVAATILIQLDQINEAQKGQAKQDEALAQQIIMAQRAARLQALTFLATFQADVMKTAPPSQHSKIMKIVENYTRKAVALLGEMGEDLTGLPKNTGLVTYTVKQAELRRLHDVIDECEKTIRKALRTVLNHGNMTAVVHSIVRMNGEIRKWATAVETHKLFPDGECINLHAFVIHQQGQIQPPVELTEQTGSEWKLLVTSVPDDLRKWLKRFEEADDE